MSLLKIALESADIGTKLYHYSNDKFSSLKTKALTSEVTKEMIKVGNEDMTKYLMPGPYYDHISFFFERPPLNMMSKIFGKNHSFWYPGHSVYEHVVDVWSLPELKYVVVESPDVTDFYYDEANDSLSDKEYFDAIYQIRKNNKEIGSNISDLRSVIKSLRGQTTKNYLELNKRPNFQGIKNKYAATVPHLMIYPEGGEIEIESVNLVIVK